MSRNRRSKEVSRRAVVKRNGSGGRTRSYETYVWVLAALIVFLPGVYDGMNASHYWNHLLGEPDGGQAEALSNVGSEVQHAAPQDSASFAKETPADAGDTDVCFLQDRNTYGMVNDSVSPCADFCRYVCSDNWYRSRQYIRTRPYRIQTAAQVMYELQNTLRSYEQREAAHRANSSLCTHQVLVFLNNCMSPERNRCLWVTMKGIYVESLLESWPHKRGLRNIKLTDISMVFDKYISLNPLVRETVRKSLDAEYGIQLEATEFPLKRNQLVFLDWPAARYARSIERPLFTFKDHSTRRASEDVMQLEQHLLYTGVPWRFLPFGNPSVTIKGRQRRNTSISLTYFSYLVDDSGLHCVREVRIIALENGYVSKVEIRLTTSSLNTLRNYVGYTLMLKFSALLLGAENLFFRNYALGHCERTHPRLPAPKTLLNYVSYSLMVKFSAMLQSDVGFLLPLTNDGYLETEPVRLQAREHMLKDKCRCVVQKFACLTFGKVNATALYWRTDGKMNRPLHPLREPMKQTVQQTPWLNQAEVHLAAQRIQDPRVEFLGTRENEEEIGLHHPQFVTPFPRDSPLLGYYKHLEETQSFYWISNSTYDVDARYSAPTFPVEVEYLTERNVLCLPHSNIGFIDNVPQKFDPLLVPLLMPPILGGMFNAADGRSASANKHHVANCCSEVGCWEYAKWASCFQEQYASEVQCVWSGDYNDNAFLNENVADNVVVDLVHGTFHNAMHLFKLLPSSPRIPIQDMLTAEKLLFVNFTVGHFERAHPRLTAPRALLNHVGYTLMIKFSALLPRDTDFLLLVSDDGYLEAVAVRLQACAHMLGDLWKYLARRFVPLAFHKKNGTSLCCLDDKEMSRLLHFVRETMQQAVQQAPWLNQAKVYLAAPKIQDVLVEFLGTRESDEEVGLCYRQFVTAFQRDNPLLGYYKLFKETQSFYWNSNSAYDLDARYGAPTVAVEVGHFTKRNVLCLPESSIGFISNVSQKFASLFVPLFKPPILRGMLNAVDRKGASVNTQSHVAIWWSEVSYCEYAKRASCFQEQYASGMHLPWSGDHIDNALLDESVADDPVVYNCIISSTKRCVRPSRFRETLAYQDRKTSPRRTFLHKLRRGTLLTGY